MKSKQMIVGIGILATALLLMGCASTDVRAVYVMAPRVVSNLKALGAIKVETHIMMSGNSVEQRDAQSAQMLLQEDMVSRLDQEARGDILVCDSYFASPQAGRELARYVQGKGQAHGYAAIVPEPQRQFATLKLQLVLSVNRVKKNYQANFQLVSTPYRLVYDPYDRWMEPESVPALNAQRITCQQVNYDLWGVLATGTLTATLHDAGGRLIYSRSFPNLTYAFNNRAVASLPTMDLLGTLASAYGQLQAHDRTTFVFQGNLWPLPTTFGIIRRISAPCLTDIIRDIIPNRQVMTLKVNESGNEELLMLIRGAAYREALAFADAMNPAMLTEADWENKGAACECLGKLAQAKYCYETALKLSPGSALAQEALRRLGN